MDGGHEDPQTGIVAGTDVCITGGGGFIGSALAEAVAAAQPRTLLLIDAVEHGLFNIERRLRERHPELTLRCVLGSVADRRLLSDLFAAHRPQFLFHAAAFKHVALLERSPLAAFANNVVGTRTLLDEAVRHRIAKFVLLSTDKAVQPHSVMGVSKRIAELLAVRPDAEACNTRVIRLVNVIGSSGSVLPILLQQLAEHKPLTVSHPQAARHFASLEETLASVFAGAASPFGSGSVHVPLPGPAVNIAALAEELRLTHWSESPIRFIGLEPGEKLVEELVYPDEILLDAGMPDLHAYATATPDPRDLAEGLEEITCGVQDRDLPRVLAATCRLVPSYQPSSLVAHYVAPQEA